MLKFFTNYPLPSYSFLDAWCWYVMWHCALDLWPVNLDQWSTVMAGHIFIVQPVHQVRRSSGYLFLSSDISHRIPLRMHLQTLRMPCHVTDSQDGKFFPYIWNRWPPFAYSLSNLYGRTITKNWVIPQNSVRFYVKDHTAICACAKSHPPALNGGINLLPQSFSATMISY